MFDEFEHVPLEGDDLLDIVGIWQGLRHQIICRWLGTVLLGTRHLLLVIESRNFYEQFLSGHW